MNTDTITNFLLSYEYFLFRQSIFDSLSINKSNYRTTITEILNDIVIRDISIDQASQLISKIVPTRKTSVIIKKIVDKYPEWFIHKETKIIVNQNIDGDPYREQV